MRTGFDPRPGTQIVVKPQTFPLPSELPGAVVQGLEFSPRHLIQDVNRELSFSQQSLEPRVLLLRSLTYLLAWALPCEPY